MALSSNFRCSAPRKATLVRVAGKDAAKFLNNFCTNDIVRLASGQGCEAFSCDAKGRVLFHWTVARTDDTYWVATHADVGDKLWAHLDRYHFREDVTLEDLSSVSSELILFGAETETKTGFLSASYSALQIAMYSACSVPGEHQAAFIQRLPTFGAQVLHLYGPTHWVEQLSASLGPEAAKIGDDDLNRRRIAMGWPLAVVDYDDKTIPQELNRDAVAISFNKGCYMGQETVARLDALGQVQRKLVGFTCSKSLAETPTVIKQDEKDVATISSWCHFPALNRFIGLGFAKRSHFQPGTVIGSSENPITVTTLPIMNEVEEH